jgi:hypothetical protein
MKYPRKLREQLKAYEAHGFHAVLVEPRAGSHFKVIFAEFNQPQIVAANLGCPRALLNNLSRFKKLVGENK